MSQLPVYCCPLGVIQVLNQYLTVQELSAYSCISINRHVSVCVCMYLRMYVRMCVCM